ncbi:hypothetical protein [Streptomyces alanosinicus]|uniref:Uncharacterized protein n=1 Tax=Streptomyces alanosinicus TaxID=68171 RepID=A0A918YNU5_9ACTN|nr:hypothetical protein [Streptomyces alanosinicus]GHE08161.1 hypothetical protein GCM10010339_55450 [Streptomyces alanosinicus]
MQWTNGSGGAYGEEPYDGAGYAFAYGHESSGTFTETATPTRAPAQHTQWTQPHPTAWDTAHGDVLTVPYPEADTQPIPFAPESAPAPWSVSGSVSGSGSQTAESEPARPVFVDVSGRRRRRVLRAARLLVIPAGGYVALLVSTVLGGTGISAPFVPQPDSAHRAPPRVTASDSPPAPGHSAGRAGSAAGHADSRPTAQRTSPPVRPTASTAPATTAPPTRATSPTATASPTPTSSSRGRALGTSHKPVK